MHELVLAVLGRVIVFGWVEISVGHECASFQEPKDVSGTQSRASCDYSQQSA
jgi:hypothetical protein